MQLIFRDLKSKFDFQSLFYVTMYCYLSSFDAASKCEEISGLMDAMTGQNGRTLDDIQYFDGETGSIHLPVSNIEGTRNQLLRLARYILSPSQFEVIIGHKEKSDLPVKTYKMTPPPTDCFLSEEHRTILFKAALNGIGKFHGSAHVCGARNESDKHFYVIGSEAFMKGIAFKERNPMFRIVTINRDDTTPALPAK